MLICSSRLAGIPASTNARSKYRELAPLTHRGSPGVELMNVASQIDRICGLMTCTRGSHLTELMLLGVAALRAGTRLQYGGAAMRVTNDAAAKTSCRAIMAGIRSVVTDC
jgi:hypothetical protein